MRSLYDDLYRPPFYRRAWFIVPLLILLIAAAAGAVVWLRVAADYRARAAAFDFSQLAAMEAASTVYDRNGEVLGRIFVQNREPVPLREVPYEMVQAVLAAEDSRFYKHRGVDHVGMIRAAMKNYRAGRIRQGASTLTQQLARNTFGLTQRTYERKLLEIFLAMEIERHLSKERILELYLNRVYFGAGSYGVQAAALGYFGKPANQLGLAECATLAGLLKNPNKLSPWSNRQACLENRDYVLDRMLELKMIGREAYDRARAGELAVKNRRPLRGQSYAFDMIQQQAVARLGLDEAFRDGYRIHTTIDRDLQRTVEGALAKQLERIEARPGYEHQTYAQYAALYKSLARAAAATDEPDLPTPEYLQGAGLAIDSRTGAIMAMVGGRDFAHSQFNRTMLAARPPGTAFKPFVYAAAFEKGIFPGALFEDAAIDNRLVMIGGTVGVLGEWGAERDDNRYEGAIPARYALVKSKNAATVRLGMRVGLVPVLDLARRAGIGAELRKYPATFLGSSEITLAELTRAYTIFPTGGWRPTELFIISHIEDRDGRTVFETRPDRRRALDERAAYQVHSCLAEVLEWGSADQAFGQLGLRRFPVAGKTGTAYNFTDNIFVGYSSAITCGIWIGFDKPHPIYRGAFASQTALPIWVETMNASFARYPPAEIPAPAGLRKIEVCLGSGQLATPECSESEPAGQSGETISRRTTYFEWATPEQMPKDLCQTHHGAAGGEPLIAAAATDGFRRSEWPRAQLAVNLAGVSPVMMQAPTVVGPDDPFQALRPTGVRPAVRVDTGELPQPAVAATPEPGTAPVDAPPAPTEVRRAEPARALEGQTADDNPLKIEPPPALEF